MLQLKTLTTVDELAAIADSWDQLLSQSLNNSYSLSWTWLSHWLNVYLGNDRLLCVLVYDDARLVGIAPFWVKKLRQLGIGRLRILRFIGSEEVCADHLDLIISRKNSKAICAAIWEELHGPLRKEWDFWEYNFVPAMSPVLQSLTELADKDNRCLSMNITGFTICPYAMLPDSWETYITSISRSSRGNLKTSTELLTKAGNLQLRICDSHESLPGYLETHMDLHRKSWNDRGQDGSYTTETFKRFHRELSQDLLSRGQLMLCSLELDGVAIGSFYGFIHEKVIYYYLLGVNRAAVPKAGIGRVLLGKCIEAAIGRKCTEFDMLRGFEEYKYYWTDTERRELLITFHNRSINALIFILRQFVNRFSKQVGKVLLGGKTKAVKQWLGKGTPDRSSN